MKYPNKNLIGNLIYILASTLLPPGKAHRMRPQEYSDWIGKY